MTLRPLHHPFGGILFILAALFILAGCDYARMKEQEAVKTYKTQLPDMPEGTIPVEGGVAELRASDPRELTNPFPHSRELIAQGKTAYGHYCIMCHGPRADGNGTVGQSFFPLPTNLGTAHVQEHTDGELFYKISFGYKRHPPLGYTVPESDRWAVIHFMRSLGSGEDS